jgi:hypothetical protein
MRTILVAVAWLTLGAFQTTAQDLTSGNGHYVACKSFADRSGGGDAFMRGVCAGTINALKIAVRSTRSLLGFVHLQRQQ